MKVALEEQEKKKKAQKKPPPKGQEEPDIRQADYKFLSKEILMEMIQQRTQEEDCNAGVIFDHLESPYWPSMKFAIEAICDGLAKQNVQVLLFNFPKEGQAAVEEIAQPVVEGGVVSSSEEVKEEIKPKDFTKEE